MKSITYENLISGHGWLWQFVLNTHINSLIRKDLMQKSIQKTYKIGRNNNENTPRLDQPLIINLIQTP
jgi:hypothetical protein